MHLPYFFFAFFAVFSACASSVLSLLDDHAEDMEEWRPSLQKPGLINNTEEDKRCAVHLFILPPDPSSCPPAVSPQPPV